MLGQVAQHNEWGKMVCNLSESELGAMSLEKFRSIVRRGGAIPTDRYKEKDITSCRGYTDANVAIIHERVQ